MAFDKLSSNYPMKDEDSPQRTQSKEEVVFAAVTDTLARARAWDIMLLRPNGIDGLIARMEMPQGSLPVASVASDDPAGSREGTQSGCVLKYEKAF